MSTAVVLTLASLAAAKRYLGSKILKNVAVRYGNKIEKFIKNIMINKYLVRSATKHNY